MTTTVPESSRDFLCRHGAAEDPPGVFTIRGAEIILDTRDQLGSGLADLPVSLDIELPDGASLWCDDIERDELRLTGPRGEHDLELPASRPLGSAELP